MAVKIAWGSQPKRIDGLLKDLKALRVRIYRNLRHRIYLTYVLGRAKVDGIRTRHQNFSIKFKVNLLEGFELKAEILVGSSYDQQSSIFL
jgi:hypothetical protein